MTIYRIESVQIFFSLFVYKLTQFTAQHLPAKDHVEALAVALYVATVKSASNCHAERITLLNIVVISQSVTRGSRTQIFFRADDLSYMWPTTRISTPSGSTGLGVVMHTINLPMTKHGVQENKTGYVERQERSTRV